MKKIAKVLAYLVPYKSYAILGVIFNILTAVFGVFSLTMMIPFLEVLFSEKAIVVSAEPEMTFNIKAMMNWFNWQVNQLILEHSKLYGLFFISALVMGLSFLKNITHYFATYFIAPLRMGIIRDIRNKLFTKILTLPIAYYTGEKRGDIISKMTSDVTEIEISVMRSIDMLFKDPILLIVYIGMLLFMDWQLTLMVFVLLPITGGIIGTIGRNLRKTGRKGQNLLGSLMTIVDETLSGFRVVKAFNAEAKMKERFLGENQRFTHIMIKMWRRRDLANPLSEFLGTGVIVSLMIYGGNQVLNGDSAMSPSTFLGYLALFSQIISPAKSISTAYYNIQKGLASIDRINEIMKAENPIKEKENALTLSDFRNELSFENVGFKYEEAEILKNINLKIKKGQTVALVGQSGSGKTTLVDLVPRFWDIQIGDIKIDGTSIKDLKIHDLRGIMGNVNQEPILFNDSIFNNIAFGVEKASMDEVIAAAKVANAHEFIIETELGYETNIGDGGSKLSGGQRQRLSIARAVLKNPPILILDEATSALDTNSERLVQEALNNLMKSRTSIVIAHRLSTIVSADLICVMHEGQIVEKGSHDELIQLDGHYSKLHKMQMS
ncbi:MAG: ATP-binding cassette domain-containing protein [Bacteroidales bacterium]|nr:ATP-binding cassette domain-containing protein [Bacteroidales bacterium]